MSKVSGLSPAIEKILTVARWAPSGDNAQPWTFETAGENIVRLNVRLDAGNVYEYRDGEPTLISAGTLLENIEIAAPHFGKSMAWRYLGRDDASHRIELHFADQTITTEPPLFDQIQRRSVDRRPYKLRRLSVQTKRTLSEAAGQGIAVEWYDRAGARLKIAGLNQAATDIRLRIPETFDIHNRIVDWDRRESPDAIPSRALGLDPLTLKIMRWSLARRSRTEFVNRMGSPFFAGLQMDLLPGLFSAAYFGLRVPGRPPEAHAAVSQLLRVGQAVQRLWLTATSLGLALQPCLATLAFAFYGAQGVPFTASQREQRAAAALAQKTRAFFPDTDTLVFLARIGFPQGSPPPGRSTRLDLAQLTR